MHWKIALSIPLCIIHDYFSVGQPNGNALILDLKCKYQFLKEEGAQDCFKDLSISLFRRTRDLPIS